MNKIISKVAYYVCWATILIISLIYAFSSTTPWTNQKYDVIEPAVHLDTKFMVLPGTIYGASWYSRNEYLIEKSRNFYSSIGTTFLASTHYRPDFEQYPVETSLILFFRLFTYTGLVIFLFLLSQILRSVFKENPFDEKNFERLLYMGLIWIFLPIVRMLHSMVLAAFINYNPRFLGYEITPSFQSLWLVLIGILILFLSFFYKETARIHEEQKLTV